VHGGNREFILDPRVFPGFSEDPPQFRSRGTETGHKIKTPKNNPEVTTISQYVYLLYQVQSYE
jgi:hypothetical protein